ncbi:hypothetical protein D3C71_1644140 [compost metagenome]
MIDQALAHQRDGFETAVRVAGKARHAVAVVHAPAVLAAEVAAHLPAFELHRLHAHAAVAGRVAVVMVGAEQERVERGPLRAQRLGVENGLGGGGHGGSLNGGPAADMPQAKLQIRH